MELLAVHVAYEIVARGRRCASQARGNRAEVVGRLEYAYWPVFGHARVREPRTPDARRPRVANPTRLAAENLFLRKQLALYIERQVKPRRADNAARIASSGSRR